MGRKQWLVGRAGRYGFSIEKKQEQENTSSGCLDDMLNGQACQSVGISHQRVPSL
jgi:hypothetical protein